MNNTTNEKSTALITPADLDKKIEAKRAALAEARTAHAAASAVHDAAKEAESAALAAVVKAKPGCITYLTPEVRAAREAATAAHADRLKAYRLVSRREYALAALCDQREAARIRTAEATAAAPVITAEAAPLSGVDLQRLVNEEWNARCEVKSTASRAEAAARDMGEGSAGHLYCLEEAAAAVKRADDLRTRLAASVITKAEAEETKARHAWEAAQAEADRARHAWESAAARFAAEAAAEAAEALKQAEARAINEKSNRLAALSAFLGYSLPSGSRLTGLPAHFVETPSGDGWAVVTLDEAATTSYAFEDNRDATEKDCITYGGETYIIFPYTA